MAANSPRSGSSSPRQALSPEQAARNRRLDQAAETLTRAQTAALARLTPRLTGYIPHRPHPKQWAFLALWQEEALYGGAAGGGKSDALLMGALQYVDVPGYAALMLRRNFTDLKLPGALMARSKEWLFGTDAGWNEQAHQWTFPSGATITFGFLETDDDRFKYQGAEFQYVGFDELTQFSEIQYTYLLSRLRRLAGVNIPIRCRAATNPGGRGHTWVKERFVDSGRAHGRPFIPAKLEDNPSLDRAAYEKQLAELDPVTRAQLRHGIWTARHAGAMFRRDWVRSWLDRAPEGLRWVRYWDLASTEPWVGNKDPDWTVGAKVGARPAPVGAGPRLPQFVLADVRRTRARPKDVEDLVLDTAREDGVEVEIVIAQERGAAGKLLVESYRSKLPGFVVRGVPEVAPQITARMNVAPDHPKRAKILRAGPASAAMERGDVEVVSGNYVHALFEELEAFPSAGVHDDQVDGLSGAIGDLTTAFEFGSAGA